MNQVNETIFTENQIRQAILLMCLIGEDNPTKESAIKWMTETQEGKSFAECCKLTEV